MWRDIAIFLIGGILDTAFGVAVGFSSTPTSSRRPPRWPR